MGAGVWDGLRDRLSEAVSRATSLPAYAASILAAELRPGINEMASLFFGDVFVYLAKRGEAGKPGSIPPLSALPIRVTLHPSADREHVRSPPPAFLRGRLALAAGPPAAPAVPGSACHARCSDRQPRRADVSTMQTDTIQLRELTIRYSVKRTDEGQPVIIGRFISSPKDCAEALMSLLQDEPSEVFAILCLSTKRHIIGYHEVSRGTLDTTMVHPREVFRAAILANAAAIIVCHCHPSGDPTPSQEDITLTRRLVAAGSSSVSMYSTT